MQLGTFNDPREDIIKEISWIAKNGFDFIDFFIEPPLSNLNKLDVFEIKEALSQNDLSIVGHTGCFLPLASPYKKIRDAVIKEVEREVDFFMQLGAQFVNLHIQPKEALISTTGHIDLHIESINKISDMVKDKGIKIMVENSPFYDFDFTKAILSNTNVFMHLDIGHAFIQNDIRNYLKDEYLRERIVHVHISDNNGREDLHLPLGAGMIDWENIVFMLKQAGYDDSVTLEVFSKDRSYLLMSKQKFLKLWKEIE